MCHSSGFDGGGTETLVKKFHDHKRHTRTYKNSQSLQLKIMDRGAHGVEYGREANKTKYELTIE